jgi:hypothetical protein
MRRVTLACLAAAALLSCAGAQKQKDAPPEPELELAYDDGTPSERPLLPPPAFEWLVKFEPNLPAYKPKRLRLLLAQPGPLRLVLYAADAAGRPGTPLRTIERDYAPELASGGQDGKWLLEPLADVPLQTGPLYVGVSVPAPGNDAARLWAAARPSPQVFQRDAEPGTAMQSSRLPLTPLLRLGLTPAAPPPAPPAVAAGKSAPEKNGAAKADAPKAEAPKADGPKPAAPAP